MLSPRPGDAILFAPDAVRIPSEFYLRDRPGGFTMTSVFPPEPWGGFDTGDERLAWPNPQAIDRVLRTGYARVWIVAHPSANLRRPPLDRLLGRYRVASDHVYTGPVEVLLLTDR
jgi:hypothetical protein